MGDDNAPPVKMQQLRTAESKLRRAFDDLVKLQVGSDLSDSEQQITTEAYSELLSKLDDIAGQRRRRLSMD